MTHNQSADIIITKMRDCGSINPIKVAVLRATIIEQLQHAYSRGYDKAYDQYATTKEDMGR